jgi:hypothetical protein
MKDRTMMRRLTRAISILLFFLFLPDTVGWVNADNLRTELTITVFRYEDRGSLDEAQITILVDDELAREDRLIPTNYERITIKIKPPNGYVAREIRLRRRLDKDSKEIPWREINTYLVKKDTAIHYDAARTADNDFKISIDKALAFYEYAFRRPEVYLPPDGSTEPVGEHSVRITWGYARALHNACTVLGYDTCSEAHEHLSDLVELYDSTPKNIRAVKRVVSKEHLDRAIEEIGTYESTQSERLAKEPLRRFKEAYAAGGFRLGDAAREGDQILEDHAENQEIWNYIPEVQLLYETGLSWYRYGLYLRDDPDATYDKEMELSEIFRNAYCRFDSAFRLGEKGEEKHRSLVDKAEKGRINAMKLYSDTATTPDPPLCR